MNINQERDGMFLINRCKNIVTLGAIIFPFRKFIPPHPGRLRPIKCFVTVRNSASGIGCGRGSWVVEGNRQEGSKET